MFLQDNFVGRLELERVYRIQEDNPVSNNSSMIQTLLYCVFELKIHNICNKCLQLLLKIKKLIYIGNTPLYISLVINLNYHILLQIFLIPFFLVFLLFLLNSLLLLLYLLLFFVLLNLYVSFLIFCLFFLEGIYL